MPNQRDPNKGSFSAYWDKEFIAALRHLAAKEDRPTTQYVYLAMREHVRQCVKAGLLDDFPDKKKLKLEPHRP